MRMQIDRRTFLESSAAGLTLVFAVGIDSLAPARAQPDALLKPNLWLTIAPDGMITIVSPAAELAQGTTTTLPAVTAWNGPTITRQLSSPVPGLGATIWM